MTEPAGIRQSRRSKFPENIPQDFLIAPLLSQKRADSRRWADEIAEETAVVVSGRSAGAGRCFGVLWTSFPLAQLRPSGSVTARYVHGALHVSIPFDARRTGQGRPTVEVLEPEDNPAGRFERNIAEGRERRRSSISISIRSDERTREFVTPSAREAFGTG
jgi:hypothetical protein